ncbi:MAG: hypothetical protein J6M41_02650 [Prevotella sp.]|nr:hypothetical protein [Prevotella sp.]
MKTFNKYILAVALMTQTGTAMAQELNSAYFTDDFKYRHQMNPAIGNDQGYAAIPLLGNLNMQLQGSLGVGDFFFKNPDYGVKPGAKKTTTFMHPGISTEEALKGFKKGANTILMDVDALVASVGFKGIGGYNTVELRERTHVGLSMPYDFFLFAKNLKNQDYTFDDMGARGWSYAELALGHSHKLFDNLSVGAKVKLLFGLARADVSMKGVHANLAGDKWLVDGKASALLNMKGASFKEKEQEFKTHPGTYRRVDGLDIDGAGLSGFGLGFDLGAVYQFKDCSVKWLNGLTVSLAVTDLGFISWNNGVLAESSGKTFVFNGFNNFDLTKGDDKHTLGDEVDKFTDDLKEFYNLENKGGGRSNTNALAATLRFGLEYPLPVYDRLSFGSLLTRRFDGKYSWIEERVSANVRPLNWLDGGINVAFTSFCTTMGWVLNFHPQGFNVFVGMDHIIGKTGAKMIPLSSNFSFNLGLNVAWGEKKNDGKERKTLTF